MSPVFPALTILALAGAMPSGEEARDLRVMTFNLRYGTADDGENAWSTRRGSVVRAIEAHGPDILGTQECLAFQRDYLLERLPRYRAVGVGRDDGRQRGEMAALFFDHRRFELLADGHLWLSETPETPGSVGWDAALPRVASWILLADRRAGDARVLVMNAHFDHEGARARLESARLLREQVNRLDQGTRVILMGDFNEPEDGPAHRALIAAGEGERALIDVYRAVHPDARESDGTLGGFGRFPESWRAARIDWILADEGFEPSEAVVDRERRGGRYPSDHHPVIVRLAYRDETGERR